MWSQTRSCSRQFVLANSLLLYLICRERRNKKRAWISSAISAALSPSDAPNTNTRHSREHTRELIGDNTHTHTHTDTEKRTEEKQSGDERHFESRRDERESFTAKQKFFKIMNISYFIFKIEFFCFFFEIYPILFSLERKIKTVFDTQGH